MATTEFSQVGFNPLSASFVPGHCGKSRTSYMYPKQYEMVGYLSGSPVRWRSWDPEVATEYPGGPPYPTEFSVVGEVP